MLNSYAASAIRTLVPVLVGAILAWATRQGLPDDAGYAQPLTEVLTFAFSGGYYLAVRAVERKWPATGWLLGVPVQPHYPVVKPPAVSQVTFASGGVVTTGATLGGGDGEVPPVVTPPEPPPGGEVPPPPPAS